MASQAALMAGQRGAAANPGMIARQAAQQGGALQQQAAGQGATLQAQQQLAGMNALQNQQAMMQQLAGTQVQQQQNALMQGSNTALQGQQNVNSMVGSQNNADASIAAANQKSQASGLGGLIGGAATALTGIPFKADGGVIEEPSGPQSVLGKFFAMQSGGTVPGKATVKGDSRQNDTVPAMLSPGEIVVPRTAAKDPKKAAAFAASVAMRQQKKGKK